jgi:DNA-binding helix-turn-helix protein
MPRFWILILLRKNICFQIESPFDSVYQGVGESSLFIEVERLKLALSHASEKEKLLNKLLEKEDSEIKELKSLLEIIHHT